MDDLNDLTDMALDSGITIHDKPYRMHARVALILMAVVAVIALIPVLGFASWFIAIPMLFISFVMIILVFAKGGVAHGLALLACQIFVMPLIVIFGPFISSALGLAGTAAGVGVALDESAPLTSDSSTASGDSYVPSVVPHQEIPPLSPDTTPSPVSLPPDLQELKGKLLDQQHSVSTWVREGIAIETPSGFLKSGDSTDIDTRRSLQQQNLWREQAFGRIAELTGKTPEEVAKTYSRLAAQR